MDISLGFIAAHIEILKSIRTWEFMEIVVIGSKIACLYTL